MRRTNRVISNRGTLYNSTTHPLGDGKSVGKFKKSQAKSAFRRNRDEQAAHGVNISICLGGHRTPPILKKKQKRAINEQKRTERTKIREALASEVLALRSQGFDVESMNGFFQYRVNGELDIYPKGHRWCDVYHKIWGD